MVDRTVVLLNRRIMAINRSRGWPTPPLHSIAHSIEHGRWRHNYAHMGFYVDPKPICLIIWAELLMGLAGELDEIN